MRALLQELAIKQTNQDRQNIDTSIAHSREDALVRPEFDRGETLGFVTQ